MKSAALRRQLEQVLAGRYASPFDFRERGPAETVPSGVAEIDALTGGLPRGALTEIVGPASSGRTSLLLAALAALTARQEACALVDAEDTFDPHSAETAGVCLDRLLWVRCGNLGQALKATDMLLTGGGFGLVAVDLGNVPPRMAGRVPLACWFRFRRVVENTPTMLLAIEPAPYAKTCASLVLQVEAEEVYWSSGGMQRIEDCRLQIRDDKPCGGRRSSIDNRQSTIVNIPHTCLLHGVRLVAEVIRSRGLAARRVRFETWLLEGEARGRQSLKFPGRLLESPSPVGRRWPEGPDEGRRSLEVKFCDQKSA